MDIKEFDKLLKENSQLSKPKTKEKKDGAAKISGKVEDAKYAPSLNGVYIIGKDMQKYIGKTVEAEGIISIRNDGPLVDKKTGMVKQGHEGDYQVMQVKKINIIK